MPRMMRCQHLAEVESRNLRMLLAGGLACVSNFRLRMFHCLAGKVCEFVYSAYDLTSGVRKAWEAAYLDGKCKA